MSVTDVDVGGGFSFGVGFLSSGGGLLFGVLVFGVVVLVGAGLEESSQFRSRVKERSVSSRWCFINVCYPIRC